ncbi:dienelactone hydrolase family protein [Saccharothrix xinjiangensis]|uniref:Dienelactone hydrolase family protein n=1 Tax=Saccharothrix xinjiangensis TaxID=204798 RepID=A0ABV9YGN5_9PSEU
MFVDEDVRIPLDGSHLDARLTLPARNSGVVVFAHGSGRHSPCNRHVADVLQREHVGTLLLDLLPEEERGGADPSGAEPGFDVPTTAGRLAAAVDWLADRAATRRHPIGLFGGSTGAAAALVAAAERPAAVRAVVCGGGRTDLAEDALTGVLAPTLLIVGEQDERVVEANQRAVRRLRCGGRLEVVPGAGHLFEEPGALDHVARAAARWFHRHVGNGPVPLHAP